MSKRLVPEAPGYNGIISDELTTHEVAQLLGFSDSAVILWVKKGLLPVRTTPGGHRRFKRKDVDFFASKIARGDFNATPSPVEEKLEKILKKPGIKPASRTSK